MAPNQAKAASPDDDDAATKWPPLKGSLLHASDDEGLSNYFGSNVDPVLEF